MCKGALDNEELFVIGAPKTGAQLRDDPDEREKRGNSVKKPNNRSIAIHTAISTLLHTSKHVIDALDTKQHVQPCSTPSKHVIDALDTKENTTPSSTSSPASTSPTPLTPKKHSSTPSSTPSKHVTDALDTNEEHINTQTKPSKHVTDALDTKEENVNTLLKAQQARHRRP